MSPEFWCTLFLKARKDYTKLIVIKYVDYDQRRDKGSYHYLANDGRIHEIKNSTLCNQASVSRETQGIAANDSFDSGKQAVETFADEITSYERKQSNSKNKIAIKSHPHLKPELKQAVKDKPSQ